MYPENLNFCCNVSGSLPDLLKYKRRSQLQVLPIMTTIDKLNRIFSNKNTSFALGRGIGFQPINNFTPLKVIICNSRKKLKYDLAFF